jgi:hypothetical protein
MSAELIAPHKKEKWDSTQVCRWLQSIGLGNHVIGYDPVVMMIYCVLIHCLLLVFLVLLIHFLHFNNKNTQAPSFQQQGIIGRHLEMLEDSDLKVS